MNTGAVFEVELNMFDKSVNRSNDSYNELESERYIKRDEKLKKQKWIFKIHDSFRIKWDLLIIILSTWNIIFIPINAAFEPQILESIAFDLINSVIDIIFIIDVFVNFRMTYIDPKTGEEEWDTK